MFPQIGEVVGDYRIVGALGSGGMGAVYRVEHVITRRIEAMKVLASEVACDTERIERFVREIQVHARLHHPNIAAVYNAFRAGSHFVMVMEFVEGESLETRLGRGPIPLRTGLDYARQVLRALAYAHAEGVVHRDVAPGNIIITPRGTVKLTDFGLARTATDLRLTRSGAPVGSPWYMSPEQVTGSADIDPRTDLYSMGAVLSEILTGRKLFDAETAFAVMRAHVEVVPVAPSLRARDVPPALDGIVLRALAKDPAARFQSAEEFRRALESADLRVAPAARPARIARTAAMAAVVPTVLVAGLCTVRFYPHNRRPPAAPVVQAAPAQPPAALEPAALEPAAPVAPAPDPLPAAPRPPVEEARRPPSRSARPAIRPKPAAAIRVTGGEVVEPAVPERTGCPPPQLEPAPLADPAPPSPPQPAEVAEPKPVSVEAPPVPEPAAAAKPKKTGNRFLRVLGKIVPFRKAPKEDSGGAAKQPAAK